MGGADLGLPVPINWLRAGLNTMQEGLLVFIITPLQHYRVEFDEAAESPHYWCANSGTEKHWDGQITEMPGPISMVKTVNSHEQEVVEQVVSETMNGILNGLNEVLMKEARLREYAYEEIELTPETIPEEIVKANPDAILGIRLSDNDGSELWEIWVYHYRLINGEYI